MAEVDVRAPSMRQDRSVKLPLPQEAEWAWQLQGSCRDHSVGTFFPDTVRGEAWLAAVSVAKRICRSCPVIEECRDFAVKTQERWGIWGALTPAERTALRRGERLVFEDGAMDPETVVANPGVLVASERAEIDLVTR